MQNYHIITIKYLPATNTKGSRVRLSSARFRYHVNGKYYNQSIIIPFDYSKRDLYETATDYLTARGHNVIGRGEVSVNELAIICDDTDGQFLPLVLQSNCGAKHTTCGKRKTHYTIVNGSFVYTCLHCDKKDFTTNFTA